MIILYMFPLSENTCTCGHICKSCEGPGRCAYCVVNALVVYYFIDLGGLLVQCSDDVCYWIFLANLVVHAISLVGFCFNTTPRAIQVP